MIAGSSTDLGMCLARIVGTHRAIEDHMKTMVRYCHNYTCVKIISYLQFSFTLCEDTTSEQEGGMEEESCSD